VILSLAEHGNLSPLGGDPIAATSQADKHSKSNSKEDDKKKVDTILKVQKDSSSSSSSSESSSSDSNSDEKFKKKMSKSKSKAKAKLVKGITEEKEKMKAIYLPESFSNSLSSESDEEYKIYKTTKSMELKKARERKLRYQKEADRLAFSRGLQKLGSSKGNSLESSESSDNEDYKDTSYYKLLYEHNSRDDTSSDGSSSSDNSSSSGDSSSSDDSLSSKAKMRYTVKTVGDDDYIIVTPKRNTKVSTSSLRSLISDLQKDSSYTGKRKLQIPNSNKQGGLQIISTTNVKQNEGKVQTSKNIDTLVHLQQNTNGMSHGVTIGIPQKKSENLIYVQTPPTGTAKLDMSTKLGNPVKGTVNIQYNRVASDNQNQNSALFGVSERLKGIGNMLAGLGIPGI